MNTRRLQKGNIMLISASDKGIVDSQLCFYRDGLAGCIFAAIAARDPIRYGWLHRVISLNVEAVDAEIKSAVANPAITTLSLIFPKVDTLDTLIELIDMLKSSAVLFVEQDILFDGMRCIGFRAVIEDKHSWVSGFGPFTFFPRTRQTPYSEIAFRVKQKPNYCKEMKKAPSHILHLAHMDMRGLTDAFFKRIWYKSIGHTAHLLGHKPNLKSAAKTTFTIPA